jgi:hypothetical protein
MSNPFIVSSDVGNPASAVGGQPVFFNTAGTALTGVSSTSASFATYAQTAFSASYALSASVAARTSSVQS